MSDNHGAHLMFSFFKIFSVGQYVVNSWGRFLLELKSCIENNDVFPILNDGHILSNLFHTTQWNNSYRITDGRNIIIQFLPRKWTSATHAQTRSAKSFS